MPSSVDRRPRWIDLHLHSTASDGAYPPAKVVEMAQARGLSAIALTDHDTLDGLAEAADAAKSLGLEFLPGAEFEAVHGRYRVHLLAYDFDPDHADLRRTTREMADERHRRNAAMISRLRDLGLPLDYDVIRARHPVASIGRPHLAQEMVRLGHVSGLQQAFSKYLGDHAPAYVPRQSRTAEEIVRLVRQAGGLVSLAHPGRIRHGSSLELATLVGSLREAGLSAIETLHPDHLPIQTRYLEEIRKHYGLLATGGSDFHALGRAVSRGTGFCKHRVPYDWLMSLHAAPRA